MKEIQESLAGHRFQHLFIECLGWDRIRVDALSFELGDSQFTIEGIAQKRGFAVFVCETHRTVLANRQLLRDVQKAIRKSYHEHILIHHCETPKKQVWQWAIRLPGGKHLLLREHPFFSHSPPPRLLDRLGRLGISWEEEKGTTLTDVVGRVREVLQPENEFELFAKYPSYAAKSDSLAMALKRGEPRAFDQFVEFHMPLARKASRMLIRWFDMAPDDAEQTAMIGLLEAARRFDPELGYQFSTYASFWIRKACQRHGLEWGFPLRVPDYMFWPCYRMQFVETELTATFGEHGAARRLPEQLREAGIPFDQWERFKRARDLTCFSDVEADELQHLIAPGRGESASASVLHDDVAKALDTLNSRHATILSMRYGIGQREHTLQEVADHLGITRARVQQLQVKAEERLQSALRKVGYSQDSLEHE